MCKVLTEQAKQISKLSSLKKENNIEYFEENGALVITAPVSMPDNEAEKLSKQVGAIDRGLTNKFSEYKNMMKKDARLYDSM